MAAPSSLSASLPLSDPAQNTSSASGSAED